MNIGIDFGTSFSQVSTIYMNQPYILLDPGEYGIPSEFYYDSECGIIVGQDALEAGQGAAACNLVSEVKMNIASGKNYVLDGRVFSSKEIIKEIYKFLIVKAVQVAKKRSIHTEIEGIVISVPAKFGIQERYLIAEAAVDCMETTKLPLKAIIKEPVAAAIAYYNIDSENNKYILVYDLGGGTCDIALVKSDSTVDEHYVVIDSDMIRLGGRDWDKELVKYLTDLIEDRSGKKIYRCVGVEEKIRRAAIKVKHDLSDPSKSLAIARVELYGEIYSIPVSRKVFDEITCHLLEQTFECLQEVYDRNVYSCDISEIICVGGSSNMLQVEEGLLKRFPKCQIRLFEPEYSVVYGAALYANMKQKENLVDTASFSYGSRITVNYGKATQKNMITNLVIQGEKLPAINCKKFNPVVEGQKVVSFYIYESDNTEKKYDFSYENKRYVGVLRLKLPDGVLKNHCIDLQIGLNREGMLEVEASEPFGGKMDVSFDIQAL